MLAAAAGPGGMACPLPSHLCRRAGDTDREGVEGLDAADIIAATPEKLDAVTRSAMRFFADIGLVLIGGWVRRAGRRGGADVL